MSERISAALDKLTPRERTVFELKPNQGLKLRTIGEMLNTTEETAKNTLFRATRKLRAESVGAEKLNEVLKERYEGRKDPRGSR